MSIRKFGLVLASIAITANSVLAAPISYVANFATSGGDPVTDVLILEEDAAGNVYVNPYASDLTSGVLNTVYHEPSYDPVKSMVLGLTKRANPTTSVLTDTIMFMDSSFLASQAGKRWSEIFTGIGYVTMGDNLKIVSQGASNPNYNSTIDWFKNSFYNGPGGAAAFSSRGSFSVAEFSVPAVIGGSAVSGNWNITSSTIGFHNGYVGVDLAESATDVGPFVLAVQANAPVESSLLKTVTNNSGVAWDGFTIDLLGSFAGITTPPGGDTLTPADALLEFFQTGTAVISDQNGFFTVDSVTAHQVTFSGLLLPGQTASFLLFIDDDIVAPHRVVIQQTATAVPEPVAGLTALAGLGLLGMRRRRRALV